MNKIELEKNITELLSLSAKFADKEKVQETLNACSSEIEYVKKVTNYSRETEGEIKKLTSKVNELSSEFEKTFESNELGFDQKLYQMSTLTSELSEILCRLTERRSLQNHLSEEIHSNEVKKKAELLPLWKKVTQLSETENFEKGEEVEETEQPEETALKKFEEATTDLANSDSSKEVDQLYSLIETLESNDKESTEEKEVNKPKKFRFFGRKKS